MGHEAPDHATEVGPGRRPDVVEARPVSAPAAELRTLDALAERAANSSVDTPASPALRASSVQRLQLRAGNAAVAAMLQRRAAPPPAVRKSAVSPRKPGVAGGVVGSPTGPLQRSATSIGGAAGAVARDGGVGPATESVAPAGPDITTKAGGAGTAGAGAAAGTPASPSAPAAPPSTPSAPGPPGSPAAAPPSPSLQRRAGAIPPTPTPSGAATPIVQRSFASMLAEARRRAAAPSGPDDTKSVEGDTDLSDFTDKPDVARQERAAIPPSPPPPKPAIPAALKGKVGEKPPAKPPKKKVGKALVSGPKGRPPKGGPGAKGGATPGEIVKKPAPPLPPTWKKPAPGKPVAEIPAAPATVEKLKPNQDPAFAKVIKAASLTVKKAKKHPTGKKESESAQGAAVPPGNDIDAQAKAKRADTMATAKPKPFDEEMFVTAVKQELAKTAPKSLNEAGDVGKKAADAKGVIGDKVGTSKEAAAGDVEKKSQEPPNPGDATPKPVTPMAPLEIEKPEGMKASGAMPAPVPSEAIDMREGPAKVDNEMGEAGVTEEQLAKSNEPEFTGALDAKKEGEKDSAEAPAEIRKAEGAVLKQAGASAAAVEKQSVGQANTSITDAIGKIAGQKNETKSKDELKRKEVADKINGIFDKTKSDVDGILKGLDEKVDREFTAGEAEIRASFTSDWRKRLDAYKDDRYSGLRGGYRWVRDKFKGLPEKANQLFEVSRKLYEDAMDKLVRRIATIVTQELTKATVRIEQGRGEVSAFVSTLKGDLAKFGQEAADDVSEKFGNLDSSVKDKFDDMASNLAKKYAESRDAVNTEIEAAKEANKGLIDKAIGAVKAVIRVIGQLKDMVLTILAKIADVIGKIIADPIGFLKRFLSAVGDGISRFAKNIGEHLQKGLMGWLFGALGATGIEIPESFSIEGILKLVMSVLGFTWDFIKQRLVKKIGEPAVNALVQGADLVKKVVTGGPGALWEMIVEKFTDFQSMVIDEIKNFVMEKVVKAGISWLLGLLTPAGAFIKACQAIYSIVMFFVERGSEIKEFVESIIDTAGAVARGEGGGIAEKIEGVLARLLPLAISFLANLLGLGGIGDKVRSIIDKVQKPIGKAIDKVLDVVLRMTAPIWKGAKKLFNKGKELYGKAKDKAVAVYEKGKDKVKQVGGRVKDMAVHAKDKVKAKAGQVISKGKDLYDRGKKKVTDTAKAAKDKVVALFKRQEKPFAMKGKAHTLIAEPGGKGFKIKMKSNEELLSSKIAAAVASLKARAETETGEDKKKTESQIRELAFIQTTAEKLEKEAAAAGAATVGATGAPPGFEGKMARLGAIIAKYGQDNDEVDITKAESGVQVDMALLAKFGLPIASYIQAQKAADQHGGMIQIRATNEAAPKLLEQGLLPKPEFLKMKTVNEDDVLLGVDPAHLSKPALFLPRKPVRESFKSDAEFARATDRWKFRTQEYKDIMTVDKHFQGLLTEQKIGFIDTAAMGAAKGGVIVDTASGMAFTGDHDLFRVTGNKSTIINELEKPPFRAQHGAHMDWIEALQKMADSAKKAHLVEIFNNVIKKHVFGPKGEALLQVNKEAPPTTAHASIDSLLPPVPVDEKADKDEVEVVTAGPHGSGAGGAPGGDEKAAGEPKPAGEAKAGGEDEKAGGGDPPVVKETFDVEGESHSVSSGNNGELVVASDNPTALSTHPDAAVRKAFDQYRAAVKKAPTPAAKRAASAAHLSAILSALKPYLAKLAKQVPRESAPGIGNIAPYSGQVSSLRKSGVPRWFLEGEHVIPQGVSSAAFDLMGYDGVSDAEYRQQHTIMIYKDAADLKTNQKKEGDKALIARLKKVGKEHLANISGELAKTKASQRQRLKEATILDLLHETARNAVGRTYDAVEEESKLHGADRGKKGSPEKATPSEGKIFSAANDQAEDIMNQLRARRNGS